MPRREAKKAIDRLNEELKRTPEDTGVLEGILEQARDDIEEYTPEAVKDLIETLQRESKELEVEHPQVTALVNQVMHTLSGLGI